MKIDVPGRICLFGEHSDWAGGYRRINADIVAGASIITGTDQCIRAKVTPHPGKLVLNTVLPDGSRVGPLEAPMKVDALREIAAEGGFFSYAAGVAYQVLINYRVRGLVIDNYRTDLPVKKGLSSSAAVCVLVARAFNRIYDLKLTTRGEMELAYLGEISTPSRCGRLDQGCAFGQRPILMRFDGDRIELEELTVGKNIYLVVVDLGAKKDTREILNRLNHCYPFAEDQVQKDVQRALGPVNRDLVQGAAAALARGDAAELGALMSRAQLEFDRLVAPVCRSQLEAPVLHKVLSHPPIQPYIFGGKGVGSQGDGSAQLITRDEKSQRKVMDILARDFSMSCLRLCLHTGQRVRKAVIPAAGFGARLFPATKAVKKELFPVVTADGRTKPAILAIVEEAVESGIEEVCVLVQPDDVGLFESIFHHPPSVAHYNKLSREDRIFADKMLSLGRRMTFLPQPSQDGFGHAVWCARDWVDNEPFLLMLGDHLYRSGTGENCASQLIRAFARGNRSIVGLMETSIRDVHHFGCVAGQWREDRRLVEVTLFAEKPTREFARENLVLDHMKPDRYLALFGLYVLKPAIFRLLGEDIKHNLRRDGEFQLTPCLDRMRREDGFDGLVVDGERFDIGNPPAYRKTVSAFARKKTPSP